VLSVKRHHPDARIIILNDFSPWSPDGSADWGRDMTQFENVTIENTICQGAGEVNPYLWSMKDSETHTLVNHQYVFLHDTTRLRAPLQIEKIQCHDTPQWLTFWHSGKCLHHDLNHDELITALHVDNHYNLSATTTLYTNTKGDVSFGTMGMWNAAFARNLQERTNVLDVAKKGLFVGKSRRSCWERLLPLIAQKLHIRPELDLSQTVALGDSLFGDIWLHPSRFHNTNAFLYSDHPIVKVWKNR
jgi:hypothetical protein